MTTVERPLRRDAQRNRERILAAAGELFAERGLAATLDDVAARAGLGVGTVYRRFSSREELIDALFEDRVLEVVRLADQALAIEDPWEALCAFIEGVAAAQACDRGLKEVLLGTAVGRRRVGEVREQMRPRAQELVRRAKAAGVLREDFDPTDLPLLQMMLGVVAEVAPPDRPDLWRRQLRLIFDGMRADPAPRTPLEEPPLGFERVEDVMCRWRPSSRLRSDS